MFVPLLDVEVWFCVAGAGDFCTLSKVRKNVRVFVAFPKTMVGVGHLKRICKDALRLAGAVRSTRDMFTRDVRRSGR